MKKAILIFVTLIILIGGMLAYYFYAEMEFNSHEFLMLIGLLIVISFATYLGIKRIQSVKKSQTPEDELSKGVMRKASSTAYYLSLYSWLAMTFFSEDTKMEMSSFLGLGIMLMAVEFAIAWVYYNFFGKVK